MAVVPFGTGLAPWRHLVDAESLGPKNIAVGTAVAIVLWEIAFFSFDNEKTTHGVKTPAARIMTRRREALLQNTLYPKDQFSDSNPGTLAMKLYLDEERPAPASRTAARRPEEVRASLPTGPAEERSLKELLARQGRCAAIEQLLKSVNRQRPQLKALLAEMSDRWGYEERLYRFYHPSFKVYSLQNSTRRIVNALRDLAPHLKLNAWFERIIAEGTGRKFRNPSTDDWPGHTRPVLEAFFHARAMLEMAVRYADLPEPPEPMPSGWAALLCLYNLHES